MNEDAEATKYQFEPYWTEANDRAEAKNWAKGEYSMTAPMTRQDWDKAVDNLEIAKNTAFILGACLDEAKAIITGERQDQYGNPEDSFTRVAEYWSVYLEKLLSPKDIAHMMILFKMARCQGQVAKRDSYIDIAGYASIAADRLVEV